LTSNAARSQPQPPVLSLTTNGIWVSLSWTEIIRTLSPLL
jgi:hypothetical protein